MSSKIKSTVGLLLLKIISGLKTGSSGKKVLSKDIKPVFILSSGRTGTKFLAEYFADFPNTFAVHEPRPSWRLRMWSMARLEKITDDRHLTKVFSAFRASYIDRSLQNNHRYIESNPFLIGFATAITNNYPRAIIVHVVRDPREYVRSAINHGASSGLKGFVNKFVPYWNVSVKRDESTIDTAIRQTSKFWYLGNKNIIDAVGSKGNYHLVKFEDLFSEDNAHLEKLATLLNLDARQRDSSNLDRSQKVNKSKLEVIGGWSSWNKKQSKEVAANCSALMEKFDYGTEDSWKEKIT